MVEIKSENAIAIISELGAEIQSVKINDAEYIWHGDPKFWSGRAPLLFPICGGLIDNKTMIYGKEYKIPKHGFAQNKLFKVENIDDSSVTFLLTEDSETLEIYPFHFELRVNYKLTRNRLDVTYNVTNKEKDTMYYSIGSHEAYACPEGFEKYDIVFPVNETLNALNVTGSQLDHKGTCVLKDGKTLPLYNEYFTYDALVFEKFNSKSATLRNRTDGREVTVEFPDATMLLIWTKPNATFVCIEPWCGAPDYVDSTNDFSQKIGIKSISPQSIDTTTHSIFFK